MLLRLKLQSKLKRATVLAAIMAMAAARLIAQNAVPDPAHMRIEFEDERVRVIRVTLAPGESTGTVALNERINVSATDGRIKVSLNGKDLGAFDVKAGTVRH